MAPRQRFIELTGEHLGRTVTVYVSEDRKQHRAVTGRLVEVRHLLAEAGPVTRVKIELLADERPVVVTLRLGMRLQPE